MIEKKEELEDKQYELAIVQATKLAILKKMIQ